MRKSTLNALTIFILAAAAPLLEARAEPSREAPLVTKLHHQLKITGLIVRDGEVVSASTYQVCENGDAALERVTWLEEFAYEVKSETTFNKALMIDRT